MDTHSRLRQLMAERGWTAYRLAKESGLSESTLANIFKRNTVPSIGTLESVCSAFGISLTQFFAESEMVELTPELKELFDNWASLTPEQKQAALQMIQAMNTIAIQEIIKEYQRQKTNQRSRKGGSARKPQQYHAEAEVII